MTRFAVKAGIPVELGDGCVVNRAAVIETHLFHDRLMRIGPATLASGSSLGPYSVVLPDTVLGAGAAVGARSVVLRGEELPPGTSWHGFPGHQRVIGEEPISLPVAAGGPDVVLLDALQAGLDEPGLRDWARTSAASTGAADTSRSYRYPYALVASHSEPVGVDVERIEPFEQVFLESILTPSERRAGVRDADPDRFIASLWSSKEALSKALGDAVRYDPRRLDSPMFWPDAGSGPWRAASLPVPAGHVAWLCWRSASTGARCS